MAKHTSTREVSSEEQHGILCLPCKVKAHLIKRGYLTIIAAKENNKRKHWINLWDRRPRQSQGVHLDILIFQVKEVQEE